MAEPWESAPVVEDDAPWAAAPAVEAPAAPARPLDAREERVQRMLSVPGGREPLSEAQRRAWAEGEADKQIAEEARQKERRGGLMGMVRDAVGLGEVVVKELSSLYGIAKGGATVVDNALKHAGRAVTGGDTSTLPTTGQAFDAGVQSGVYEPRTEEGQAIDQGPVMREIRNAANAVPVGQPVRGMRAVQTTKALSGEKGLARIDSAIGQATARAPRVELAQKALDAGIPLRPDMLTDNKLMRMAGEAAEGIPFTGGKGRKAQRQEAFNQGIIKMVDPESKATKLTPEVYEVAMTRAGEEIGEISARTDVPREAFGDLAEVARRETPDVQKVIDAYTADVAAIAEQNGGVVPGTQLRKLRTEANAQMRATGNGDLRRTLGSFIKRLDDGLSEHAPDGDMPALLDARRRYAVGMSLEPLVAKSANGDISPAALMARATADKAGKRRMARGKGGDLGDYAQIGQQFLKEQASSGTAERNMVYKLATDAATAAKAATLWAPATLYNVFGPRAAKWMVEREARNLPRAAEKPDLPSGPAPLALAEPGSLPAAERPAQANPLGDLVPDWETAPGARDARSLEVVPTEGLAPAVDEVVPLRPAAGGYDPRPSRNFSEVGPVIPRESAAAPQPQRGAAGDVPAVPGRPDPPDTMIAGRPGEVAPDVATGAAMLEPDAQLAMRNQQTDRNVLAAQEERAQPVPAGEALEIKPQNVEPAGAPKYKEPAPEPLPVGEATEIKPEQGKPATDPGPVDERLVEVERLKAATDSPAVRKALEKRAAEVKKDLAEQAAAEARRNDAAELRRTAALTQDAEIKALLLDEAKRVEKADAIPTPKVVEGQPEIKVDTPKKIPAGKTKELGPDGEELADIGLPEISESFMREQQRIQIADAPRPPAKVLERGRRQTREALEKGIADGSLGKDEGALALWALDKNPNLARGLRVEVTKNPKEGDIARAVYQTSERLVKVFKDRESTPDRAAHEILHHSERMMPADVQQGIRREWRRAIDAEISGATPEVRAALEQVRDGVTGGQQALDAIRKAFKDGVLDREKHYQFVDPSEFWAVNASRLLQSRFSSRGTWRANAVRWMREMLEHVKGVVGLRSDAPVIKALDEILNPQTNTGADRSKKYLRAAEAEEVKTKGGVP